MNTLGNLFRLTLSGESHGLGILLTLEGLPPGIALDSVDFATPLARRRAAEKGTTPRKETDPLQFLTGVYKGCTTGAPLSIFVTNNDTHPQDYEQFMDIPRPGHADFVVRSKYFSHSDPRGGGMFSGRLTVALVLAGTLARTLLLKKGISIEAKVDTIGGRKDWEAILQDAIRDGDSLGGTVVCNIEGVHIGLGEPFFYSLESLLSHALFSIPGVRALEFGNGFEGCAMRGSEFNDPLVATDGTTRTNHCGGIVGGLSNGNPIQFTVGFRPAASIAKPQSAFNLRTQTEETLSVKGRHDPCFVLRCPVIVESVAAMVLYDLELMYGSQRLAFECT